jgi:hypothetical protein
MLEQHLEQRRQDYDEFVLALALKNEPQAA